MKKQLIFAIMLLFMGSMTAFAQAPAAEQAHERNEIRKERHRERQSRWHAERREIKRQRWEDRQGERAGRRRAERVERRRAARRADRTVEQRRSRTNEEGVIRQRNRRTAGEQQPQVEQQRTEQTPDSTRQNGNAPRSRRQGG